MALRIDDLATFVAVVRLGSFTAAAGQMYVTQSAVTRRMGELEAKLGVQLFDRSQRKIELTTDGRICLDYAQQMLTLEKRMRQQLGTKNHLTGLVRIGAGETVALWWLPQFALRVSRLYPGITLEMDVDLSERHIAKFEHGSLDMLFLPGKPAPTGRRVLLDDIQFSWMASPRLGVSNAVLTASELAKWPLLTLSAESNNHIMVLEWLARAKVKPSRVDVCNSMSVVANLVMAGMGVAMLPTPLYQEAIAAGKLRLIATEPPLPLVPLWVIHRDDSGLPLQEITEIASQVHQRASSGDTH